MKESKMTLKWYERYGYGFGGLFSYSFYLMLQAYFLLFFLTDVLGFNPYVAAVIYSATQWIKVLTMIFAGTIIDATCLRMGKYRSWIAIGAVLTTIFATLMFTNMNLPAAVGVPVFLIAYILQSFGYNAMWTASRAVVGPMSKTSDDAVALAGSAQAGSSLGGIIYGLINAGVLAFWAFSGQEYGLTMLTYCVLICIGSIVMLAITKKYDKPMAAKKNTAEAAAAKKAEKVGFMTMLKSLKGPMIPYFIAMTLGTAQSGFFMALLSYFTTYVLNNPAVMGYAVTAYSVTAFLGALAVKPVFSLLKSKKTVYIVSTAICAALYLVMRLVGANAVGFLIVYGLIGFFGTFAGVLLPAFANDLADYQEMRGEGSARAFTQSIAGTTIRLAAVISTMISSFGLAAVGYKTGMEMTEGILNSIMNLMVVGPIIVCALACVCFIFYRVNEKELDEYRAQKAKKAE